MLACGVDAHQVCELSGAGWRRCWSVFPQSQVQMERKGTAGRLCLVPTTLMAVANGCEPPPSYPARRRDPWLNENHGARYPPLYSTKRSCRHPTLPHFTGEELYQEKNVTYFGCFAYGRQNRSTSLPARSTPRNKLPAPFSCSSPPPDSQEQPLLEPGQARLPADQLLPQQHQRRQR